MIIILCLEITNVIELKLSWVILEYAIQFTVGPTYNK